jgi:hypothetical protein
MMRSFELSHYRRANVWLDEAPPANFAATSVVTRLVTPKVAAEASRPRAGVELYIPRGPRTSYGLLGAELVEAEVDSLEIVVSVNKARFPFQPSLASKSDEVKVGLLDEYASAVIGGAVKVAEAVGAPTKAVLRFRWAAHGLVSSSPSIFETASEIVLQLLMLPEGASDDQIRALLG